MEQRRHRATSLAAEGPSSGGCATVAYGRAVESIDGDVAWVQLRIGADDEGGARALRRRSMAMSPWRRRSAVVGVDGLEDEVMAVFKN